MMNNAVYRERWNAKKELYEKHGIVEGENLIVSYDSENGGIDSEHIKKLIDKYIGG